MSLGGPSLWLTINPADIHDPIAQVFAGENIDLDSFNADLGPDSNRRAESIASNPFASAQYFNFIILTVLETEDPFGGVNIILVGDFHQFPPAASKALAPLYWPCNMVKDNDQEILGRRIYEQFDIVVRLKTQVQVTDPEWEDLLKHVRNGSCKEEHLTMLQGLMLTDANCPTTDFSCVPWKDAVLVTPHHAV